MYDSDESPIVHTACVCYNHSSPTAKTCSRYNFYPWGISPLYL